MKKQYYKGQEVLFYTHLFGKDYFWMKDGDGTIYLIAAREEDGKLEPDFYGLPDVS